MINVCVLQYGSTPLHWAASKGKSEVVKVLLTAGATVDARNTVSYTNKIVEHAV